MVAEKAFEQVMRTADLFPDDAPIARQNDPRTSKIAAVRYSANRRGDDKNLMRLLIASFPGRTAAELSAILLTQGVNWYKAARMTTKRIADIKHELNIGPARKCKITGDHARTYTKRSETDG